MVDPQPDWKMAASALSEEPLSGKQDEALRRCRPRRSKGAPHYVYVIAAVTASFVKIGHSGRPRGRLSEMQVGSHSELRLCETWAMDRVGAVEVERQAHDALAWATQRGEWFALWPAEAARVVDHLAAGRADDARRLADLLKEQYSLARQHDRLRRAWYDGPKDTRRQREAAAQAQLPEVERRQAEVELAQAELGLWRHADRRTIGGRNRYQWLIRRARAA
jgi:hypothetical protein